MKLRGRWIGRLGMTLPEVAVSSGLSMLLLAAMFTSSYMIRGVGGDYESNVKLTSKSRLLMDQMVWGALQNGAVNRRGISEAVAATVTASQVDYTDTAGAVHSIRLNTGNIEYRPTANSAWVTLYDPNGTAPFDATQYSTTLQFSQTTPSAVQIQLTLGELIKGRWRYASVSTQAGFRNA